MDNTIKEIPFRKSYLRGIPIVGFIMFLIVFPWNNPETWKEPLWQFALIHFFIATAITSVYWISCQYIVIWMWKKYPWHLQAKKHILIETLLLIGLMIIVTTVQLLVVDDTLLPTNPETIIMEFFTIFLMTFFLSTLHEAMFFYYQWQRNFKKSAVLEKENIQGKYENLMAQINPHFLFNNLNTLTSIVEENKEGVEYIQNLSDYLRDALKQDNKQTRSIKEEIHHLKKYTFLQEKRFEKALIIKVDIEEKYFLWKILPFSLQMLVENAIKHNTINIDSPLNINIYIKNNQLIVKNNLQKKNIGDTTKLGLTNIKKRYQYFTQEKVIITETDEMFEVRIPVLII